MLQAGFRPNPSRCNSVNDCLSVLRSLARVWLQQIGDADNPQGSPSEAELQFYFKFAPSDVKVLRSIADGVEPSPVLLDDLRRVLSIPAVTASPVPVAHIDWVDYVDLILKIVNLVLIFPAACVLFYNRRRFTKGISFFVFFCLCCVWSWILLVREKEIEAIHKMQSVPPYCRPPEGFLENALDVLRHRFTFGESKWDECLGNRKTVEIEATLQVNPIEAVSVTATKLITVPLTLIGRPLGAFLRHLFGELPIWLYPVTLILFIIVLFFIFGYQVRLPLWLGSIGPAARTPVTYRPEPLHHDAHPGLPPAQTQPLGFAAGHETRGRFAAVVPAPLAIHATPDAGDAPRQKQHKKPPRLTDSVVEPSYTSSPTLPSDPFDCSLRVSETQRDSIYPFNHARRRIANHKSHMPYYAAAFDDVPGPSRPYTGVGPGGDGARSSPVPASPTTISPTPRRPRKHVTVSYRRGPKPKLCR